MGSEPDQERASGHPWKGSCRFDIHARICRRCSTSGAVARTRSSGLGKVASCQASVHPSGAYALICRVNLLGNFLEQYVASQIDVTGVLPGVTTP